MMGYQVEAAFSAVCRTTSTIRSPRGFPPAAKCSEIFIRLFPHTKYCVPFSACMTCPVRGVKISLSLFAIQCPPYSVFKVQCRTGAAKISAYIYHLSFTVCRCCRFSSASISGGIRSTNRCISCNSLSSFARSIVSFILPFSLAFALASNFSFSANRSLIVTLYFFSCPEKFSICGNHFFSMERASSFFFPAFSGLMPSRAASMALACRERETACLKIRVGICFRPVLLALSPRSKSGYFSTI